MQMPSFRILAVDDESTNLELLRQELKGSFQLAFADNGKEALDVARQVTPDLILLDIMMPELDGFETCKLLKEDESLKDIPVIFLTALDDTDSIENGFTAGAVDFVTKPFNLKELRARVNTHLEIGHNRKTISQQVLQLQETIDEMTALSETGALVATVIHDAKKFITLMSITLDGFVIPVLKEKMEPSQPWMNQLLEDVEDVNESALQCNEFMESLLSINQKHAEVKPVSLVQILQQTLSLVSYNLMQEGVKWLLEFDEDDPAMVQGNKKLIRVFVNLIVNAMDALKKQAIEPPTITCRISENVDSYQVAVIDNGKGIEPDILEYIRKGVRISTKGESGTGLGISGVSKIIKTLDGTMDVESEVGHGASFIITLPKTAGEPDAIEE